MTAPERPSQVWSRLESRKARLLSRCERYAELTIPKLCLPSGTHPSDVEQSTDYQSLGAALVNHLNNRLMQTLFQPGNPFFRLDVGEKTKAELASVKMTETDLAQILATKELNAVSVLDRQAVRPKLYQVGRHVIVNGQAVLDLSGKPRVYGIRNFCVKRTATGDLHTLAIHERLRYDELEQDVRELAPNKVDDSEVSLYRIITLQPHGGYQMVQAVDEVQLPEKFGGKWPKDKLPYHVITWDLADEADYATGLVEEHRGDFEALSALSESLLDGGVLLSEMRWLINPGGVTSVEEFRNSRNGDALAGQQGDVGSVTAGNAQALEAALRIIEVYDQRLARAFVMQSALTRNAERVTAEEIRQNAIELETAFGGVYSQLGLTWQRPVALWCLKDVKLDVAGTDIEVTVITGLDALTRNAQLEKLRAALGDLSLFEQLPDALKNRMLWPTVAGFVGAGRGVNLMPFFKTEQQMAEEQKQATVAQADIAAAQAAGQAAGTAAVEGTPQQ